MVKQAQSPLLKTAGLPAGAAAVRYQFGHNKVSKLNDVLLGVRLPPAQQAKPQRPVGAQRPAGHHAEGRWQNASTKMLLKGTQAIHKCVHVAVIAGIV